MTEREEKMSTADLSQPQPSDLDAYFLQRRMEMMIETQGKKFAAEFTGIRETIGRLNGEIAEIKRCLAVAREKPAVQLPQEETPVADGRQNEKPPLQQRPRYSDTKPEEVSIDKFFYFGSKK